MGRADVRDVRCSIVGYNKLIIGLFTVFALRMNPDKQHNQWHVVRGRLRNVPAPKP